MRTHVNSFVLRTSVNIQTLTSRLLDSRVQGQGMVEYALILAMISILVIVALKFLQPSISRTLNNISNSL